MGASLSHLNINAFYSLILTYRNRVSEIMLSYFLFNAAALLPFLFTPSIAAPLSKRSIVGPVIQANFPDPSVVQVGSTYHAFATNNGVQHVPYASSPDFNTWTVAAGRDALPSVGAWSNGNNVWAPDVLQVVRYRTQIPGSILLKRVSLRDIFAAHA